MIQACAFIGIDKSDSIPRFRNAVFYNIGGKDCCIAFIGP